MVLEEAYNDHLPCFLKTLAHHRCEVLGGWQHESVYMKSSNGNVFSF